ncbi:hypothetical protein NBRC111894_3944 [Sporolactobacillus inulinus]|uniref:Uncharacterized protein n=1 Tax=Sporolactobacillus inulinus TaxID=2078 RepID=A0A4Y1ZHD3_9BACL|nr:hypothetical protein NBRC111894_3944 [Sporolactobacillus inulinus]
MGDFGKVLMIAGAIIFLIGLCWPLIGRLPGDLIFKREMSPLSFQLLPVFLLVWSYP